MSPVENVKLKVLMVTYEFGRHIQGGVGRVVNGIFQSIADNVLLDVFLFRSPISYAYRNAFIYRKVNNHKPKCLYSGDYQHVFRESLTKEQYDIVAFTVPLSEICWCVKEVKSHFSKVKLTICCHSIVKYEKAIRNNSDSDLSYEEFVLKNVDHIQVLNNSSFNYLKEAYPLIASKKQISIIPNGINESDFSTIDTPFKKCITELADPAKNRIVLCISRWSHGKGLEYLIDAIPKVMAKCKNVKFIIAGRKLDSWENQVQEYVQMIDRKIEPVKDFVISLEWLDNKKRNTLFSIADICVMPSALEYFPYGILEPMACKVPIVSSSIDSVVDMLENNSECLFFNSKSCNELAEKISYLVVNKDKCEQLSLNAHQKIQNKYSWEIISEQYKAMYHSIVSMKE